MSCSHCNDTGRCVCLVCSGACESCRGRELMNELRPWLELRKIDPRDSKWWVIQHNGEGYRRTKKFIPLDIFLSWKNQGCPDIDPAFERVL
jgi:DnaJ-class molecular chaperone